MIGNLFTIMYQHVIVGLNVCDSVWPWWLGWAGSLAAARPAIPILSVSSGTNLALRPPRNIVLTLLQIEGKKLHIPNI